MGKPVFGQIPSAKEKSQEDRGGEAGGEFGGIQTIRK